MEQTTNAINSTIAKSAVADTASELTEEGFKFSGNGLTGIFDWSDPVAANQSFALYQSTTQQCKIGGDGKISTINTIRPGRFASDPAVASEGEIYFNTASNKLKVYNGSGWETITSA